MVGVESDSTYVPPHSSYHWNLFATCMIELFVRMKNQIGCMKEQSEIGGITHLLSLSIQ